MDLGVKSLPRGVEFTNPGYVYLDSLESIPPDTKFKNGRSLSLYSLKSIPKEIVFENGTVIWLDSLGINSNQWEGNLEGINTRRIINKMIELGLFDRR